MKKAVAILLLVTLSLICFSCSSSESRECSGFPMGTFYNVSYLSDADFSVEIEVLFNRVETSYSLSNPNSAVAKINAAGANVPVELSEDEYEFCKKAFSVSRDTDNAYNVAIYPLVSLWGFTPPFNGQGLTPPDSADIQYAASLCDISKFVFSEKFHTVTKLDGGAALDFGGIAKGYAASNVAEYLSVCGVKSALINVGGTIAAVGKSYTIGITPPSDSSYAYVASFALGAGEVCATSGTYERNFVHDGVTYHHIIDTSTGAPACTGLVSATVISNDGALSDALATAAIVMGAERAVTYLEEHNLKGVLITNENKIITVGDVNLSVKDTVYEIVS